VAVLLPNSEPLEVVLVPKPPVFELPKPPKPLVLLLLLPKPKDMAAVVRGEGGKKKVRLRARLRDEALSQRCEARYTCRQKLLRLPRVRRLGLCVVAFCVNAVAIA
jgi:hypothetical protein